MLATLQATTEFEEALYDLPEEHRRRLTPLYNKMLLISIQQMLKLDITKMVFDYTELTTTRSVTVPRDAQKLLRTVSIAALVHFLHAGSLSTEEQSNLLQIIFKAYGLSADEIRANVDAYLTAE